MRLFSRARPQPSARVSGAPRDPARPLAVMHIPKTSGQALIGGLIEAVRPRQVVSGFDLCLFGAFDRFDTIAPGKMRTIYVTPAQVPGGADVVAGHMACSTLLAAYPGAQLVTFLREPRVRLLSHWVYWRAQTPDDDSPWGAWANVSNAARGTLADFLQRRDVAAQTDNLALRMLLWPHPAIPRDDFIAPDSDAMLLNAAMARLEQFALAHVIEISGLVAAVSAWCGAPVSYPSVNETPAVPGEMRTRLEAELTAAALALLQRNSRLDARLWTAIATRTMDAAQAAALADASFVRAAARYSRLLAP